VGLPVYFVNSNSESVVHLSWNFIDTLGLSFFIIGLLFETISDQQKLIFRSNPKNRNKFICSGLWSLSRHPNYFGEILLQWGIFLFCMPAFCWWQFIAVLSPLFTMFLLLRVSGIPLLEKQADKEWKQDKDYLQYKARTKILVPFVW